MFMPATVLCARFNRWNACVDDGISDATEPAVALNFDKADYLTWSPADFQRFREDTHIEPKVGCVVWCGVGWRCGGVAAVS